MKPVAPAASAVKERAESAPRQAAGGSGWRQPSSRTATALTIRAEEYSYVYSDLKRIAVLSVCIFAILFALSFVIR